MQASEAALLELHYLPCIQYFSKLVHYPTVYIEQWENYQKGSYRNRCRIAGANGVLRLSIPLQQGKNEQQNIREVRIAYREPWQSQHWASIRSAYGNAPFFEFYADEIQPFYRQPYEYLFDFSWALLEKMMELLRIECSLKLTRQYETVPSGPVKGLRNAIHPKAHRRQPDPHFEPIAYPQVFMERHGFLPNLSILDLLFCTGPEAATLLEGSFIMQN